MANLKKKHYANSSVLVPIVLFLMILKKKVGGSYVRMYLCDIQVLSGCLKAIFYKYLNKAIK